MSNSERTFPIHNLTMDRSVHEGKPYLCTVTLDKPFRVKDLGLVPDNLWTCEISNLDDYTLCFYSDSKDETEDVVNFVLTSYYNKYTRVNDILANSLQKWSEITSKNR